MYWIKGNIENTVVGMPLTLDISLQEEM